jgi:thymidylate synthase (methanogen type)
MPSLPQSVVSNTIGECWLKSIQCILDHGEDFNDEDVAIKEVLGLNVLVNNPDAADAFVYEHGDPEIIRHTLEKFSKGVEMKNRPFTYGQRLYNKNGVDQIEWLIDRVSNKRETKSATICLLNEGDKHKNLPCLTTLDVKVRNDKLIMQFFFRSQNIVGRQYANLIALATLQKEIARRLKVSVGPLKGHVASAHIYEYDLEFANKIVATGNASLKDEFYLYGPKSIREDRTFR